MVFEMNNETLENFFSRHGFQRDIKPVLVKFLDTEDYSNLRILNRNLSLLLTPSRCTYLSNKKLKIRFNHDFGKIEARLISGQTDAYQSFLDVEKQVQSGIQDIQVNAGSFAALNENGTVETFGDAAFGADSSEVSEFLNCGIKQVVANQRAFAALRVDGSCRCWGDPKYFCNLKDSTNFADIIKLFASSTEFYAEKKNQIFLKWGYFGFAIQDDIIKIEQIKHSNPMVKRISITFSDGSVQVCM